MRATCQRVHERLARDGLVYRYQTDDGLPPGEGAFGICSFWAVECRAKGGDVAGATEAFERLLACANDVGLLGEEIDPETEPRSGTSTGIHPRWPDQCGAHFGRMRSATVSRRQPQSHVRHQGGLMINKGASRSGGSSAPSC